MTSISMLAVTPPCLRRIPQLFPRTFRTAYSTKIQNTNPNQGIIDMLEFSKTEEETKDSPNQHKVISFARAIRAIKALQKSIQSMQDLEELKGKGIGQGISGRIMAHLSGQQYNPVTKTTTKRTQPTSEELASMELVRKKQQFMIIPGIGKVAAEKLVSAGCHSLEDLAKPEFLSMLQPIQRVGFKYLDHITQPVTRAQAERVADFIRQRVDSSWEVIPVGSYRRGSSVSSDVDIMLLHPSHVHVPSPDLKHRSQLSSSKSSKSGKDDQRSPLHEGILTPLEREGLIADTLTSGPHKWQGVVRVPDGGDPSASESMSMRLNNVKSMEGDFRRADLNLVPMKSKGAAMLQLTGDTDFNIDIRSRAQHEGMHLNEYGLWRFHARSDTIASVSGSSTEDGYWVLVASETEEEIFDALGMSYVEPQKRNFSFLQTKRSKGRPRRTLL